MDFTIEINHDENLILYKHSGLLRRDDIGVVWQEFLKLKEFTELKYNLFSDYSEAKFDIKSDDVKLITEFLFSIKPILDGKKQALIVDDPRSTAVSILFRKAVLEEVGFIVQIFTTTKAAKQWLRE